MRKSVLVLGASVVLLSGTASAHFTITMPPTPAGSVDGKGSPPCGPDVADGVVTPVTGGSQLMLSINETVPHGGFYRVALALKSCKTKGCFPDDNKVYDSANKLLPPTGPGMSDHADYEMTPVFPILADNLFPHQAGQPETYMGMVQLPNVTCDKCTMQVIEFMTVHPPNGDAGYFYHHCVDLKITADAGKPIFDPNNPGGGGSGGGGMGGAAGSGGSATAGGGAAAGNGGASTGGTTSVGTGGVATTAGSTSGGTGTTTAGAGGTGTVTTPGSAASSDDGGCGIAKHSRGGASLLAALGLAYALVRRRRTN